MKTNLSYQPRFNLFQKSTNQLENIISRNYENRGVLKYKNGGLNGVDVQTIKTKTVIDIDYIELQQIYGTPKYMDTNPQIGNHPYFDNLLSYQESVNHYAVSIFLDIVGSTRLVGDYTLEEIRLIKDSVLSFSIKVFGFFGGHIQRLQGDGMFVYFVREDKSPEDAVISALNASSLIVYFMQNIVAPMFEAQGIDKPPRIRVGIDYGSKNDVLWSRYGLEQCSELTTTSLHTDLAAKLQSHAKGGNKIMIGDNVVKILDLIEVSTDSRSKIKGLVRCEKNDRYVFEYRDKRYEKWEFQWENYLLSFDFCRRNSEQKLIFEIPDVRLKCYIKNNDEWEEYNQNLYALPKGKELKFELFKNNSIHHINNWETSEWKVYNTGQEASQAKCLEYEINKNYNGRNYAETSSAYLGNHIMECKLKNTKGNIKIAKFHIFVA